MFVKLIHIRHVFVDLWMVTGIKGDNAAVVCRSFCSHTAHMRPDESKQVLLQLHFEFRWIVGSCFPCAVDLIRLLWDFRNFFFRDGVRNMTWGVHFCAACSKSSAALALAQIEQHWPNVRAPLTERPVQQWNTSQSVWEGGIVRCVKHLYKKNKSTVCNAEI